MIEYVKPHTQDGMVYEAIYAEAKLNPLNGPGPMVGWDKLSQVLDTDFLAETATRQRVAPSEPGTATAKL